MNISTYYDLSMECDSIILDCKKMDENILQYDRFVNTVYKLKNHDYGFEGLYDSILSREAEEKKDDDFEEYELYKGNVPEESTYYKDKQNNNFFQKVWIHIKGLVKRLINFFASIYRKIRGYFQKRYFDKHKDEIEKKVFAASQTLKQEITKSNPSISNDQLTIIMSFGLSEFLRDSLSGVQEYVKKGNAPLNFILEKRGKFLFDSGCVKGYSDTIVNGKVHTSPSFLNDLEDVEADDINRNNKYRKHVNDNNKNKYGIYVGLNDLTELFVKNDKAPWNLFGNKDNDGKDFVQIYKDVISRGKYASKFVLEKTTDVTNGIKSICKSLDYYNYIMSYAYRFIESLEGADGNSINHVNLAKALPKNLSSVPKVFIKLIKALKVSESSSNN